MDQKPNDLQVALLDVRGYDQPRLEEALTALLAAVRPLQRLQGARVVLKPNLISTRHGTLPCTEGAFIVQMAGIMKETGADVVVGDSPAFGSAASVVAMLGIDRELQRMGVDVVTFRAGQRVRLSGGVQARIAAQALDCDLLVNLPRVKAHAQAGLTLAVKNCFGCLIGLQKPWWHMRHGGGNGSFCSLVLDIVEQLPPILSVVDGIVAMHRTGPTRGEPYPLGVVAAGMNPVAVDTALQAVLSAPTDLLPLQRQAQKRNLSGSRLAGLVFPLQRPEELAVTDFLLPERLNPIRFRIFSFFLSTLSRLLVGKSTSGRT